MTKNSAKLGLRSQRHPDVILIVTDDQRWDTLNAMPTVQRLLVDEGVHFANAFVVNPLCCPSRASIHTGLYSHSTGVYRQAPPYGCFDWFDDSSTLATWLRREGYRTGLFGKYIDGYQHAALTGHVPPGWDRWVAFVHSQYLDYKLTMDGVVHSFGHDHSDYSTDVLTREAIAFLRGTDEPLFMVFAPAAPHAPASPAHRHVTSEVRALPSLRANYNEEDVSGKPRWLQAVPSLDDQQRSAIGKLRMSQLRSLMAVDEAVGRIIEVLRSDGRLANAMVLYTSDNGLGWGEHRWTKKEVPYEENIRVPLVIRYDAMGHGRRIDQHISLNIDLAPTIAEAAGALPAATDGRSLIPLLGSVPLENWRKDFLIEHLEGRNPVPTWCAVRTERHLYVQYRTGEQELYDLAVDPFQLQNLCANRMPDSVPLESLKTRLSELCEPAPPLVAGLGSRAPGMTLGPRGA